MVEKKGALEVEVIRARGLVGKPGSKSLPGDLSRHTVAQFRGQRHSMLTYTFCYLSTLCEGLPSGERSLHSQKEN